MCEQVECVFEGCPSCIPMGVRQREGPAAASRHCPNRITPEHRRRFLQFFGGGNRCRSIRQCRSRAHKNVERSSTGGGLASADASKISIDKLSRGKRSILIQL